MLENLLLYSALPLAAAVFGAVYTVKLVDEARDVRFAVYIALFLGLAAVETAGLWSVWFGDGGYSESYLEVTQTVVAVAAAVGVWVSGDALQKGEATAKERNMEMKNLRTELQDVEHEKELLERRLDDLQVYEEMVSSVPDMLFAIDESGGFIQVNEAMNRLLGFDEETLLDMGFHDVMAEERAGELSVESEEQKVLVEHEARTSSGEEFPVELHMARLRGQNDVSRGIVGMARDIRERRERMQRLDVLNRFFRHNVRNELTVVNGSADILVENLSGDDRRYAERIQERAKVLEDMSEKARTVGNLLDDRPETYSIDVSSEAMDVVEGFADDGDVSAEIEPDLQVEAADGLGFALENLVENAVLHAGDSPKVEVVVRRSGDEVVVEVHDDGPGMPEHEVQAILEGNEDALQHGSGIGLWAVKWIVDRSGGELEFDDSRLRGSCVSITLEAAE